MKRQLLKNVLTQNIAASLITLLHYPRALSAVTATKTGIYHAITKLFLFGCIFIAGISVLRAQTGISIQQTAAADHIIENFLHTWRVDGASVAITKNGKLVYNKGFGFADRDSSETATPHHLYRIASISKPITSIAIMKLIEDGYLNLEDTVFGTNRILDNAYFLNAITDTRIYNITVKQLLEHTGGWDRDIPCDGQGHCDPIIFPLHVTASLGEPNPITDSALIKFLLLKGLNFVPGSRYAYSNIGYLVLGKIIEKKTGMNYEDYVKNAIFAPLNICDIHLGKNLLEDKQEREAEYNSDTKALSCYGTNQLVPVQYGGWSIEAMNAHGGWISTAADLARLVSAVDGFSTFPDILDSATIRLMTTPSSANSTYAKGWAVNSSGNWWHNGYLHGSPSMMVRTASGYIWTILLNNGGEFSSGFWTALDQLGWQCINSFNPVVPANFDFYPPSSNVSALQVVRTGTTSADLYWTNGNGDKRLIVAKEANKNNAFPVDGKPYIGNNIFGMGEHIGNGNFIVFEGNNNSASIEGLDPAKAYNFTAFEYYENASTNNLPVYKHGCRSTATLDVAPTHVKRIQNKQFEVYPNPTSNKLTVVASDYETYRAQIQNMLGQTLLELNFKQQTDIEISALPNGVYILKLLNENNRETIVFIKQ